jgi:hypothetical protein
MSRKNGDRARFDIQRKTKIHDRTRIRELRQAMRAQEITYLVGVEKMGSPETGPNKKGAGVIELSDGGA